MRALIRVKKDADVNAILKCLYKYTDLEVTFGINMVVIADGKPQQLGLMEIIRHYVKYQQQVIKRRTLFDLKQAQSRCHILVRFQLRFVPVIRWDMESIFPVQ